MLRERNRIHSRASTCVLGVLIAALTGGMLLVSPLPANAQILVDEAALLERAAASRAKGREDAPILVYEITDFQCPYCSAAQSILRRVRERLEGRLRFVFRHLPLHEVHPDAQRAAEAAEAAAAQGAFWEMHDALYANGGRLGLADVVALARSLGLDAARVEDELRRGVYAPRVARDADAARAEGIDATPAFVVNGHLHTGAFDAGSLVDALDA